MWMRFMVGLSMTQKTYIMMNSEVKSYSQFQIVANEGQEMTHIFIIKLGEFLVRVMSFYG